jgi:hypothetical protein
MPALESERKPSLWWKKPTAKLSEKSKNKRCSNSFQWCSLPRPCVYVAIQDQLKTIEVSAFISDKLLLSPIRIKQRTTINVSYLLSQNIK